MTHCQAFNKCTYFFKSVLEQIVNTHKTCIIIFKGRPRKEFNWQIIANDTGSEVNGY